VAIAFLFEELALVSSRLLRQKVLGLTHGLPLVIVNLPILIAVGVINHLQEIAE